MQLHYYNNKASISACTGTALAQMNTLDSIVRHVSWRCSLHLDATHKHYDQLRALLSIHSAVSTAECSLYPTP